MATWNPWHTLETVRREIDKVFDESGTRAAPAFRTAFLPGRAARQYPLTNLYEDTDAVYLEALAPGVDAATLELHVVGKTLSISGEKRRLTDAGSPGISDPGQRVVAAAVAAGCRVEAIPGACALVTGLTASGLPTDEFHFVGFLPHKSGQRANKLAELAKLPGTVVLYESPFRLERLIGELAMAMPDRRVVLARELTKKFEEWLRGTPAELAAQWKARPRKGEFVVLVEGSSRNSKAETQNLEL